MSGIIKFIDKISAQTAVYWNKIGNDGYGGQAWSTPVEFKCRWDDVVEIISNKYGEVVNTKSKILTNTGLNENGYLFLGSLADLTVAQKANPLTVPKAFPIQRVDKSPLIKSDTKFVKIVWL